MNAEVDTGETAPALEDPAPAHRWRGRDITLFGLAFILLNLLIPVLVAAIPVEGDIANAVRALIGTLIAQLALIALIVVLVQFVYRLHLSEELRWTRKYTTRNSSLVLLGMTLAFTVTIVSAAFPPENPPIEQLLSTSGAVLMFAVYAVLFAPLLEEVMFRGFLYRVLEQMAGAKVAVRTTAIIFGLLHVPQLWGSVAAMLVIFSVGYVLSEVRHRTNSLIPSLIVHMTYNGMLFVVFLAGTLAQEAMASQ